MLSICNFEKYFYKANVIFMIQHLTDYFVWYN